MKKTVEIVGVPMALGGNRRGVDMGPSAIRYAGLRDRLANLGYSVRDRGNVRVADRDEGATKNFREVDKNELAKMNGRAHHVDEIVRVVEDLAKVVADIERAGNIAVVLGGDHSMAIGTLAGIARGGRRPRGIWMDAHRGSHNPKTSPPGNEHGSPFAVAFGLAADPFPKELRGSIDGHNGVLIALRSVDAGEKENIR